MRINVFQCVFQYYDQIFILLFWADRSYYQISILNSEVSLSLEIVQYNGSYFISTQLGVSAAIDK